MSTLPPRSEARVTTDKVCEEPLQPGDCSLWWHAGPASPEPTIAHLYREPPWASRQCSGPLRPPTLQEPVGKTGKAQPCMWHKGPTPVRVKQKLSVPRIDLIRQGLFRTEAALRACAESVSQARDAAVLRLLSWRFLALD